MSTTKRRPLVLIADDDAPIRDLVRFALQREGFDTVEAGDGAAAIEEFTRSEPDLIVLDILMPELDGTEVCRELRSRTSVPIIFLSSKDEELDRILGLELGGDDYVTKPFSPRELVARVRAVLRRRRTPEHAAAPPAAESGLLRHGRLVLDLDRYQVSWNGRESALTATEFALLRTLMRYPGKVYSRDELIEGVYGPATHVTGRTIDSHVRRVRRKLGEGGVDPIETVHGLGYKLGPCDG